MRHGGVAGNMSKKVGKGEETGVSPNLHAPPPVIEVDHLLLPRRGAVKFRNQMMRFRVSHLLV